MKNKIIFSSSGGSTKFIAHAQGHKIALKEYGIIPTDLFGVSSGGIVSFTSALSFIDENILDIAIEMGLSLKTEDIFPNKKILFDLIKISQSPVNKKDKISFFAIYRALTGQNSFGIQNIEHFFTRFVDEKLFEEFQKSDKTPNVWIMAVAPKDMSRKLWNLKNPDDCPNLERAKKIISATSHIPIFAQPVIIDGISYVDGGLRNHNPSPLAIKMYKNDIKELYSFYTRPEEVNLYIDENWDENLIKVITRVLEGMSMEISKRDFEYEKDFKEVFDYRLCQIMFNRILKSQYSTNPEDLKKLSDSSIFTTRQKLTNFYKKILNEKT